MLLEAVESDEAFGQLIALAAGLRTFHDRGRRVPDLRGKPSYAIVREVILPKTARLFYLHVTDSDEVVILGFLLKGQTFSVGALGRYFQDED